MRAGDWLRSGGLGTVLGGAALLLAVADTVGAQVNRSLQADVGTAQARLARARTFVQVDDALVQLLARTAADKDDAALRDVLARNGVTFRRTGAGVAGGGPASARAGSGGEAGE